MNIKTLAEQAYSIITGGKDNMDNKTTMQEVRMTVREVCDTFMVAHLKDLNKSKDKTKFVVPREYWKKVTLSVIDKEATLTERPLKLPRMKTILECEVEGENCDKRGQIMVPIHKPVQMYELSESSTVSNFYRYQVNRFEEGVKIKVLTPDVDKIAVYFVESAMEIGLEDELNIPSERYNDILIQSVKTISPQTQIPEDIKQDNAD